MQQPKLLELSSNDHILYETEPDENGFKRYFLYNECTKDFFELAEETYQKYLQRGAYTNIVSDEDSLKDWIAQKRESPNFGINSCHPERMVDGSYILNFRGFADYFPEVME